MAKRRPTISVPAIRMLVIAALLFVGLGAAGKASSGGPLPIIYLDIPPFPQTPVVVALTQRGSSVPGVDYDLTLAPPAFFEEINRPHDALVAGAYRQVVFVLVEYHYHDGLHNTFTTNLVLDGMRYSRPVPVALSDDGHNRVTALQFPDMPIYMLDEPHTWQLSLPPDEKGNYTVLTWETPLQLPVSEPAS
jgi:hypothetical protein